VCGHVCGAALRPFYHEPGSTKANPIEAIPWRTGAMRLRYTIVRPPWPLATTALRSSPPPRERFGWSVCTPIETPLSFKDPY
jgi:hypothetical protein